MTSVGTISSKDETHIYYNATVTNTTTDYTIATSTSYLSNPFLQRANDYKMSVIRFTIPGQNIPILIFKPNYYQISLTYKNVSYQQYVSYIANNVLPTSDPEYYYVYSYENMLQMFNVTLFNLWTLVVAANPGDTFTYSAHFELSNNLLSLYCTPEFEMSATHPIRIILNIYIYNLMFSFPNQAFANQQYALLTYSTGLNNITNFQPPSYLVYPSPPSGSINGIQVTQEFTTLYEWNDAKSVIITSSNIPVRSENFPSNGNSSGNPNIQNIITDYVLAASIGPEIRSNIVYIPSGEYRWSDLTSNSPLSVLDFSIFWVDRFQNAYPVYLSPNTNFTIKILFQKVKESR